MAVVNAESLNAITEWQGTSLASCAPKLKAKNHILASDAMHVTHWRFAGRMGELTSQHVLASSQVRQQMQAAADDLLIDFQRRLAQWQQLVACHAADKHAK